MRKPIRIGAVIVAVKERCKEKVGEGRGSAMNQGSGWNEGGFTRAN